MSEKRLYYLTRITMRALFALIYRHKIYGIQHLIEGPAILAPNHASFYDPPIIAASAPETIHFLARESLFRSPSFGWLIRQLNSHPISKTSNPLNNLKTVARLLQAGHKVVIFPEGTRSKDGELLPIKQGVAMLSLQTGCPIIPVWIAGTHAVWGRHRRFPRFCGKTACVFGKPLQPKTYLTADDRSKERIKLLSQQLEQSLKTLEQWYKEGAIGTPP